jgi:hypothetical protein
MSKNKSKKQEKILLREKAEKEAKRQKILIICVCALIAAVVLTLAVLRAARNDDAETYSDGFQTIRLFNNGSFTATLAHGTHIRGNYKRINAGGKVEIHFTTDGNRRSGIGYIENGELEIPWEWQDGCGHGNVLRRR